MFEFRYFHIITKLQLQFSKNKFTTYIFYFVDIRIYKINTTNNLRLKNEKFFSRKRAFLTKYLKTTFNLSHITYQ